ncbi:MAG: hypothetical protein NTV05_17020 [Acidobacteria bacterium]|nr:hypothetical protein [Acidobacteriota bacterium]
MNPPRRDGGPVTPYAAGAGVRNLLHTRNEKQQGKPKDRHSSGVRANQTRKIRTGGDEPHVNAFTGRASMRASHVATGVETNRGGATTTTSGDVAARGTSSMWQHVIPVPPTTGAWRWQQLWDSG